MKFTVIPNNQNTPVLHAVECSHQSLPAFKLRKKTDFEAETAASALSSLRKQYPHVLVARCVDKRVVPLNEVEKLYRQIRNSAVYEDRLEYCIEDLMKAYSISEQDAEYLQRLLHAEDRNFTSF